MKRNRRAGPKVPIVSKIRRTNKQAYTDEWEILKVQCKKRDNYRCVICNSPNCLTVDHIIPVSCGGLTVLYNLRTLCIDCHILMTRSKGGKALLRGLSKRMQSKSKGSKSAKLKDYL